MDWDLSNVLSAVGITASIINILVVMYIYNKWTAQKQREVIANDAGMLMEEIKSLEQEIYKAHNGSLVDANFIAYLGQKRDSIEDGLKMIHDIDKNLVYEPYIDSLTELIRTWQKSKPAVSAAPLIVIFLTALELNHRLRKLKLFA